MKRCLAHVLSVSLFCAFSLACFAEEAAMQKPAPDAVLQMLKAGNDRFSSGKIHLSRPQRGASCAGEQRKSGEIRLRDRVKLLGFSRAG